MHRCASSSRRTSRSTAGSTCSTTGSTQPTRTEDLAALTQELTAHEEILLLSRQTFEDLRAFWPQQSEDTTGVSHHLDEVDKHVVTSSLSEPDWQHTTLVDAADWQGHVERLRARSGGEICVTGSVTLCHALSAAGLVDEYRLFTYPVWQGRGRGLFGPDAHDMRLRPTRVRSFGNGITFTAYETA